MVYLDNEMMDRRHFYSEGRAKSNGFVAMCKTLGLVPPLEESREGLTAQPLSLTPLPSGGNKTNFKNRKSDEISSSSSIPGRKEGPKGIAGS
jgi:hypothetical protein